MNVRYRMCLGCIGLAAQLTPIFDTVGTIASEVVHPDHINVGFEGEWVLPVDDIETMLMAL